MNVQGLKTTFNSNFACSQGDRGSYNVHAPVSLLVSQKMTRWALADQACTYVVVNFLSQVIFIFHLFQHH